MKFELWKDSEGYRMISVPRAERGDILHDPKARLLIRFEAESSNAAEQMSERFIEHGNPDGLQQLNLAAKELLVNTYRCGLRAGDIVRFIQDYYKEVAGRMYRVVSEGTVAEVLAGDKEAHDVVILKVLNDPGQPKESSMDVCHILEENVERYLNKE